jgi:aspartyl-tRNA(Asn)/glutamyl-tRNA(Gln) amidotransferase subunit A
MTELHYATVAELGRLIRSGETSPTELTRLYIERLDTVGRELNAVVTITEDRAMREAEFAEKELRAGVDRGPLHGIPYGLKDLVAAHGYPTTWGAAPFRDQVFDYDAHIVERMREAGAVLVAKLAMIELAGGMGYEQPNATFTGPCRVPWNRDAFTGGSSSGSGAAVTAGLVGFAIGSETRGSIHSPAANCGCAGVRPTYGRVSRHGAMALSWTMDKLGPMARSADDCGLVLDVIAGHDPRDPSSAKLNYSYPSSSVPKKHLRFGVVESQLEGIQPAIRKNFEQSVEVLREIGSVEPVEMPDLPYAEVAHLIIRSELAAAFEEFMTSGEVNGLTAPENHVNGLESLAIPAHAYLRALRIRRFMCQALDETMSQFDALLTPTTSHVAPPIDSHLDTYFEGRGRSLFGPATNVAGLPGVAVPNGFGERGLPTSLCITGRPWDENIVLSVANAYQAMTEWHRQYPDA